MALMRRRTGEQYNNEGDEVTSGTNQMLGARSELEGVGAKTIGSLSSVVFVVNQIFGPGVLALPIGITISFCFSFFFN